MIGIIPAAGVGTRMAAEIPKQYLRIADYTVLEHSCHRLLADERVCEVFVAVSEQDKWFNDTSLYRHEKIQKVMGGQSRAESVLNCLKAASEQYSGDQLTVVHDAARPCLPLSSLRRLLDAAEDDPKRGAILAMPVRDTMKRSTDSERGIYIESTVNRDSLWHALTPQVFQLEALHHALSTAMMQGIVITDEASAMEQTGVKPLLIQGDQRAMKLTEPGDYPFIKWLLSKAGDV